MNQIPQEDEMVAELTLCVSWLNLVSFMGEYQIVDVSLDQMLTGLDRAACSYMRDEISRPSWLASLNLP